MKPSRRMVVRLLASVGEGDTIVLAELRACMSPFGLRSAIRLGPEQLRRLAVPRR